MLGGHKVIDLAEGDPSKGDLILGPPFALAFTTRAHARIAQILRDVATSTARPRHRPQRRPYVLRGVVAYVYFLGIPYGVLGPDDPLCAISRTPSGLPNDPLTISRWRSPE